MLNRLMKPICRALVLTLGLELMMPMAAHAGISNLPPLMSPSLPPNVVFTLDDSGSMRWEAMPDNAIQDYDYGYPIPSNTYRSSGDGGVTAAPFEKPGTTNIDARRFRSIAVNKIYYNPDLLYEPWSNADGTAMDPADPTRAKFNPVLPTGVASMSTYNLTTPFPWNSSYAGAYPAVYYRYNPKGSCPATPKATGYAATNEVPACYEQVEIRPDVSAYYGMNGTTKSAARTDCPGTSCTYDQEIQNYANWFQFWRSRTLIARGGVGKAFAKQGDALRVGWGAINRSVMLAPVRNDFSTPNRNAFFDFLYKNTYPSNGTPLRTALDQVGQYFTRTDVNGPWQNVIGNSTSGQFTCRQNFHILMTDGYWNGSGAGSGRNGNYDMSNGPIHATPVLPAPTYKGYVAEAPYKDTNSGTTYTDTLANIAMYYWRTDLRPDLTNNVPTATKNRSDPAYWQHLVNFTVGLGVNGQLNFPGDYNALKAGTLNWPAPAADSASAVDDLWHAAVNSRGKYYSASNPKEFSDSLGDALQEIADRSGDAAAVGASSNTIRAGTSLFTSTYRSTDWSGDVSKVVLDPATGKVSTDQSAGWVSKINTTFDKRKIYTWNSGAKDFTYSNLTAAQKTTFDNAGTTYGSTGQKLFDYIRGGPDLGIFRPRPTNKPFGDFINSAPEYLKEGEDEGYIYLPTGTAGKDSYQNYLASKKSRQEMVYIGGNDGMFHAFNATTGAEEWAYVPNGVINNLPLLADKSYAHRYYVDGTPITADYYSGGWKTAVIGTTGAGGRSVFAIDVTTPLASQMGTNKILWEVNSSNDTDIGYTIGRAQIGRLPNGNWVAIFGNGYYSNSGKAILFVVNMSTGAISKIDTGIGSNNGLSTPRLVIGSDATIKQVYAGDLRGNLWKFDFNASGNLQVAYSGQPLFKAVRSGVEQPITVQPEIVSHPNGGAMVVFGTGKIFEDTDAANMNVQSMFGVWDNYNVSGVTPSAITSGRSALVQQTLTLNGTQFYQVSNNTINWTNKRGWYIDLDLAGSTGERVTIDPLIFYDQAVFTTIIPGTTTDPCSSDGKSTFMQLNYLTGGPLAYQTIDRNNDGVVDSGDLIGGVLFVSGKQGALTFGTTILEKGKKGYVYHPCANALVCQNPEPEETDKIKLPTVRLWRQLFGRD